MKLNRITDKISTIEDFLDEEECRHYIQLSEEIGYEAATVNAYGGAKVVEAVRNNRRAFHNSPELAQRWWTRAKEFVPAKLGNSLAIGFNELFRFYQYGVGHRFKKHVDESYVRNGEEISYFTFMVYLNDDFNGGETQFREHEIVPKRGMALCFLHNLEHEGSEVSQGTKYVLRTEVMYRLVNNQTD
ncbi:MAG: 2OG-Fe(II) oxygenase [Ferruginibacter sp.]|nr:2OG-Fe(II) oxygenase [Cytophagales bacterium]